MRSFMLGMLAAITTVFSAPTWADEKKSEVLVLSAEMKRWALENIDIKDASIPVLEKVKANRCGMLSNPNTQSLCEAALYLMIARRLAERAEVELILHSDQVPADIAKPLLKVVSTQTYKRENDRSQVIGNTIDQVFPAKTSALVPKGTGN